jgi:hypothetical protein
MALETREEIKFKVDLFFDTTSVEGTLKRVDWATAADFGAASTTRPRPKQRRS